MSCRDSTQSQPDRKRGIQRLNSPWPQGDPANQLFKLNFNSNSLFFARGTSANQTTSDGFSTNTLRRLSCKLPSEGKPTLHLACLDVLHDFTSVVSCCPYCNVLNKVSVTQYGTAPRGPPIDTYISIQFTLYSIRLIGYLYYESCFCRSTEFCYITKRPTGTPWPRQCGAQIKRYLRHLWC